MFAIMTKAYMITKTVLIHIFSNIMQPSVASISYDILFTDLNITCHLFSDQADTTPPH